MHGNANVAVFQGNSIVDAITRHAHNAWFVPMQRRFEGGDDSGLVLREHLGEAVRGMNLCLAILGESKLLLACIAVLSLYTGGSSLVSIAFLYSNETFGSRQPHGSPAAMRTGQTSVGMSIGCLK